VAKIASIQMEPVVGEKQRNVRRSLEFIEEAADNGVRLVVLPELCNTSYVFNSGEEAFDLADEVPTGSTCRAWEEAARKRGLHIVARFSERDGPTL
jgi:N-carbamoylputrescine amidase